MEVGRENEPSHEGVFTPETIHSSSLPHTKNVIIVARFFRNHFSKSMLPEPVLPESVLPEPVLPARQEWDSC